MVILYVIKFWKLEYDFIEAFDSYMVMSKRQVIKPWGKDIG